jgi:apolipoprotein N-acyltransferase
VTRAKRLFLAALSGLLLALAFPKWEVNVLAWVAFVPLLWSTRGATSKKAFFYGWVGGMAFYLASLYWVVHAIGNYSSIPMPLAVGPLLLMCAILALYTGGFLAGVNFCQERGVGVTWIAPFLWVALEWLRSFFFIGFPWISLGYSQHPRLNLIQLVEVTGVYGISALVIFVNVALYALVAEGLDIGDWRRRTKGALATVVAALLLITLSSFGAWRRSELEALPKDRHLRVALVQGNIEQDKKWDPEYQETTVSRYEMLTKEAAAEGVDLVVWPESAAPFYFQSERAYQQRLLRLSRETGAFLLFGSPAFTFNGQDLSLFNRAYLTSPVGKVAGYYDKIQLAPFGEYIPFQRVLFFIDKLVEGIGNFAAGTEIMVFTLPQGRFGVLICYEDIFSDLTRRFVAKGADFLVNITNDAWYGRTSAPYQHLTMAAFRAVENRVPLVRAANTGFSAFVDTDGRVRARTGLFETTYRTEELSWPKITTFYTNYGDVFAYLSALVSVFVLEYAWQKAKIKRQKAKSKNLADS